MNIALVTCPNPLLEVPTAHFPQSLLYVGEALRLAGHKVQIVDLRDRKVVNEADIPKVDVVGVTATSGEFHWAKEIAKIAKKQGSKTAIGGAHATFMTAYMTEVCSESFDIMIKGDGEVAFVEALKDGSQGAFSYPLESLDGYFPDWQLVGERGFSKELFTGAGYGQGPLAAGSLTSRGCNFQCSYCRSTRDKVRYRPIDEVVFELQDLKKRWGIRHFRFYDESLTLNKKRALALFSELEKLKISFRAHTRSDLWDDELAEAAKKSGCDEMGFGMESADNKVLEIIRKQETVECHREAVRVCKRHGVICKAFFMVGLPSQGWREIEDIKRFMIQEKPDKWILSTFSPYPGSDIWSNPDKYGVNYMNPDLSQYWNFSPFPVISYKDNPSEAIYAQYIQLKRWMEENFVR